MQYWHRQIAGWISVRVRDCNSSSHDFRVRKRYVFKKIYVFLTLLYDQNLFPSGGINLVRTLGVKSFVLALHHFFWVVPEFSILECFVSLPFWYFPFSSNCMEYNLSMGSVFSNDWAVNIVLVVDRVVLVIVIRVVGEIVFRADESCKGLVLRFM